MPLRLNPWLLLVCLAITTQTAAAADRTAAVTISSEATSLGGAETSFQRVALGGTKWDVPGWEVYDRIWRAFASDPKSPAIRKYLGLPIGAASGETAVIRVARGRSAPRWIGWAAGSYLQLESPHFRIYCRADERSGRVVAEDLERVYWVWTQMFFPFWDGRSQVALHAKQIDSGKPIDAQLARSRSRLSSRKKLRVILFRDADEYQQTLGRSVPGVEQSTGFYGDERQTSFFYPSGSTDAAATRRHELIHQLFREATSSSLGSRMPGADKGFWLVEGIAGYFESLQFGGSLATTGGWDSPRLQFARYRVLAGRDVLPWDQLEFDGMQAAQKRSDLARWYAHAIAQTHHLLDGENVAHRRWVYQRLADLYEIKLSVPGVETPAAAERSLTDFLTVNDQTIADNPTDRPLEQLCLAGCEVTSTGLQSIGPAPTLQWLDLSRLPITSGDVVKLCPQPQRLSQLSLEATRVDATLADWISKASALRELDLSWTACDDSIVAPLASSQGLKTLWLTGTKVTDGGIGGLANLPAVESIDLQRTGVTPAGLAKLKQLNPQWNLNPLQLIAPGN